MHLFLHGNLVLTDLLMYISSFMFIYILQFYSRYSEKVSFTDVDIREIKVVHFFYVVAGSEKVRRNPFGCEI